MTFRIHTMANGHLVMEFGDADDSVWVDFSKRLETEFELARVGSASHGMDEQIHQSFHKSGMTFAAGWDNWSGHYLMSESAEGDAFIRMLAEESNRN